MNRSAFLVLSGIIWISISGCGRDETEQPQNLPIDVSAVSGFDEVENYRIRNLIDIADLRYAVTDGEEGLKLDLGGVKRLLDGTNINPSRIYGYAWIGPYPFEGKETRFHYKRFRHRDTVERGTAILEVGYLLEKNKNSEDWEDDGTILLRLDLRYKRWGRDRSLGMYDIPIGFLKTDSGFIRLPWIEEGPFVNLIRSETPGTAIITLRTDRPARPELILNDTLYTAETEAVDHSFPLTDLEPETSYSYSFGIGNLSTPTYRFQTAPEKGVLPARFAYCGDSREGHGSDHYQFMGTNAATLEQLAARAYALRCDFFLMGGDLINGYTTSVADFRMQLYAWKQCISGFWHERPVYPVMGNHEALVKAYDVGESRPMRIDRWPYETASAEAIFAEAFINPDNGPQPGDARRPSYAENVFSFTYGAIRVIGFNNNYWVSSDPARFGGCPEGYLMPDQLEWIQNELEKADGDSLVRYVFLYAQEPVFPCGGHIKDAMWYNGDNRVRAAVYTDTRLVPEPKGMIEVRNDFVRMVHASEKVSAVFCSDEHAYHRILIDSRVPLGVPELDDANGDSLIDWKNDESASSLSDLEFPVWYITCGGGGAPYYAEQPAPWNRFWLHREDGDRFYRYSSQENLVVFDVDSMAVEMTVYNKFGELMDHIPDLMAVKEQSVSDG